MRRNLSPVRRAATRFVLAALLPFVGACLPPAPAAAPAPVPTDARSLRPGDVVRLAIWREPDLSGDFTVDESGMLVLPMIGKLAATSFSDSALRARIVSGFDAHLVHASVNVLMLHQVRVLGAVRNPGLYAVEPTLTPADLIARAGGLAPSGDITRVDLVRDGRIERLRVRAGTLIGDEEVRSGDELVVAEHRWLLRNPGVIAATITATAAALIALSRR